MADPNVRPESVNVVQIMDRIRARIRETRGAEYTDAQIRELASATLQRYLDPRGVRPELVEKLRQAQTPSPARDLPSFEFEEDTLFESTRPFLRFMRKLLLPILKLFFNPNPLIRALNIQSRLNKGVAEREASRDATRYAFDQLHYEAMHNIVVEMTRLAVENKNLRMQLESLTGRLEFTERRARAVEAAVTHTPPRPERAAVVEYRPEPVQTRPQHVEEPARTEARSAGPAQPSTGQPEGGQGQQPDGQSTRSRRRRRRRGRRGGSGVPVAGAGAAPADHADGHEATADLDGSDRADGDTDEGAGEEERSGRSDESAAASPPQTDGVHGEPADSRTARPEPFEHTFGAQAHPAEPAAGDPSSRGDRGDDTTGTAEPPIATARPTAES